MAINSSTDPAILLISLGVAYGGAESYYVKLAKILQKRYRVVAIVCSPSLARNFEAMGVDARFCGDNLSTAGRYIQALKLAKAAIRECNPALAHLNGQPESYLAPFLRLLRIRVVTTRHTPFTDLYLEEGSALPVALKRALVLFCLRRCRATFCVSALLQRQLRAYVPSMRLPVVPTWVEEGFLEPYERPAPSFPLRALFVGRVVRNKGIFDLVEAMRRCQGVHLTVIGTGPDMPEAIRLAEGLPIDFRGFSDDSAAGYRTADVVVFASPEGFEGLPQVPLEAMAMRVPCLASDISSILEIAKTEPGREPVLATFRQGNAEDLAMQFNRLSGNLVELARLGRAGHEQVLRRFTVRAVTGSYLNEFAEAAR